MTHLHQNCVRPTVQSELTCEGREGRVDRFERVISVSGSVPQDIANKIVEIAGKCPVHRTLEAQATVVTSVSGS